MYCKFCGKRIDDNSKFCSNCGEKLTETESETKNESKELFNDYYQPPQAENEESAKSENPKAEEHEEKSESLSWLGCLAGTFMIFIFMIVFALAFDDCTGGKLQPSDYESDTQQGLLSYSIMVTPERDISECSVELELYDYKDKLIYTRTITKTNLRDGNTYTYLFKFDFLDSLKGTYVKYSVTGER